MDAKSLTMGKVRIDGEKLETLRRRKFLSRAELGSRVGLHPDHIGRLERGDWEGGSRIDNIRKLAEALGVEPQAILRNED